MPKKLFALDVRLVATAYIKADTAEAALSIAKDELVGGMEFSNRKQGIDENLCMDGRAYEVLLDNEEDVALSPAMTFLVEPLTVDDLSEAHTFAEEASNDG